MTIDEMLDRVADKLGVEPPKPRQTTPAPQLSTTSCQTTAKSECTDSCSEHKCSGSCDNHSDEHKCGGHCHDNESEHKCGGHCHDNGSEHKCSRHCHDNESEHKCGGHCHDGGAEHKCSGHCHDKGTVLDLAYAKRLADGLESAAAAMGVNVVIAIVNEGGNLMCLHAMDDSYIASIKASRDKAFTAVALKMPTHVALKESRGGSLDGYTNGNGILMLGGGFPLEKGGRIYGGIGISGGTKEQDTLLAQIGAEVFRRL